MFQCPKPAKHRLGVLATLTTLLAVDEASLGSQADYASASISAARGDRQLEPVDTHTVNIADDDTVADQRDDAMDAVKNDDDTSSDGTNTGDDDSNDSGDSDTAAEQPRVLPLA